MIFNGSDVCTSASAYSTVVGSTVTGSLFIIPSVIAYVNAGLVKVLLPSYTLVTSSPVILILVNVIGFTVIASFVPVTLVPVYDAVIPFVLL